MELFVLSLFTGGRVDKYNESMSALFWEGSKRISLKTIDSPTLEDSHSIIVEVKACAICGSDLRTYAHGNERIKAPQIIGHEISGIIIKKGDDVNNFKLGDRVSVGADIPCGECLYCERGYPNNCMTNLAIGYQYKGGFAKYIHLDSRVIKGGPFQKFSESLSFEVAALAEPLACCLNGYEVGLMKAGLSVAVFGAGPIGHMLAMLAKPLGASDVFVFDPVKERLASVEKLVPGAVTFNPLESNFKSKVLEHTDGRGVDLVFTACPAVETHTQAIDIVAKRGVVNFFGGLPKSAPEIKISSNHIHYNEIYLTGSHGSTPVQHKKALDMLESREIDGEKLITHRFDLAKSEEAFECALNQEGLKIVLCP